MLLYALCLYRKNPEEKITIQNTPGMKTNPSCTFSNAQAIIHHFTTISFTLSLSLSLSLTPTSLKILHSDLKSMATATPELRNQRKPRTRSHSATPKSDQINEARAHLPRRRKIFTFFTLKGMGCGRILSPAAAVRSPEKTIRRRKKKNKKQRRNRGSGAENLVVDVPDVCCTPPGIGFTYDVAQSTSGDARRRNHRQRSRATRQATVLEQSQTQTDSNISDASQHRRPQPRSLGGISEIVMFERNPLLEGSLEGSDRFGAWRLNADIMSYEELMELSEKIGYVGGGLQEDEILSCLKRPKQSFFKSFDFNSNVKDSKCSICQEECKGNEELGRLECGHYHHLDCIKQWLLRKNACPICKTAAKSCK